MAIFYLIMRYETIIDPIVAETHVGDGSWAFIDCRFDMKDPDFGEREYEKCHVPSAVYAHLDRDLSGPVIAGVTGRHPLPSRAELVGTFRRLGIGKATQVVTYDESNGSMAAARLWWLLRWAGHAAAAVLDGGIQKWKSCGFALESGVVYRPMSDFEGRFRSDMTLDASQVQSVLANADFVVLDSRTEERFRGLNETIDPVAGHIPGAFSAPYKENLRDDGTFKTPQELASRFAGLASGRDAAHVVFYCGSGVTAAHNVLAFAHAGNGVPLLYPGSWSEWITDAGRPIAVGAS
jgi:thiosulfate/3-mercaptopyruvate sulfurtransferase